MILYLDTSLVITALTNEADTHQVQAWLHDRDADDLAVSDWVATEVSSALSIKMRMQAIEAAQRAEALAMFARLCSENLVLLAVSPLHFRTAAHFANQETLGLRAGDALHLAVCAEHGAILCTRDRRLAAAGPALGVQTRLV